MEAETVTYDVISSLMTFVGNMYDVDHHLTKYAILLLFCRVRIGPQQNVGKCEGFWVFEEEVRISPCILLPEGEEGNVRCPTTSVLGPRTTRRKIALLHYFSAFALIFANAAFISLQCRNKFLRNDPILSLRIALPPLL